MSYIGNQPSNVAFLTDTFNGTGSQTAFTMSVAPASTTSVLVAVTGVLQDPSTYSVSGTTLTFSAAPPSGTGNISVRYMGIPASGVTTTAYRTLTEFTATSGQTSFSVPSYTVGYINVYRNGALLGTADYTATNGTTVVLGVGATVGDLIAVESFYVSSVLNAIPATTGAVSATYLNTDAVTTVKIADANVTTAKIADANVTQAKLGTNVAGNGPAFSASKGSAPDQTVSANTWTKVLFDTEEYDTNNNFASSRFTPTVAGYYQINGSLWCASGSLQVAVYKTGVQYKVLGISSTGMVSSSVIVYCNGTTDYVELYGYTSTTSFYTANNYVYLQGALVRAA